MNTKPLALQQIISSYKSLKNDPKRAPTNAKVVLIHPNASIESNAAREQLYGDLSSAGSTHPPQGLCLLAAVLRENGYSPEVIDAECHGYGADEIAELAMKDDPQYIGISSYTLTIKVTAQIALRIKAIAKARGTKVSIIIGGPHITYLAKTALKTHPQFDIGIIGEAEITLVEILDALEGKNSIENIPNLAYLKEGEVKVTARRGPLTDLDELPLPAWDLLPPLAKYYHPAGDNLYRLPSIAIVTSRGCPGNCVFCNPRGLGAEFRRHSAACKVILASKMFLLPTICFCMTGPMSSNFAVS